MVEGGGGGILLDRAKKPLLCPAFVLLSAYVTILDWVTEPLCTLHTESIYHISHHSITFENSYNCLKP